MKGMRDLKEDMYDSDIGFWISGLGHPKIWCDAEKRRRRDKMTKKRERTTTQHDMIVTTAQLPKSQNPSDTAAAQRTKNEWRWMNIVLTKFHSISWICYDWKWLWPYNISVFVLKNGLRILIQAPEVPFLVPPKTPKMGHFGCFWLFWGYQNWHFGCPNQNSKTTFQYKYPPKTHT